MLSELGRREEALTAAQEAADLGALRRINCLAARSQGLSQRTVGRQPSARRLEVQPVRPTRGSFRNEDDLAPVGPDAQIGLKALAAVEVVGVLVAAVGGAGMAGDALNAPRSNRMLALGRGPGPSHRLGDPSFDLHRWDANDGPGIALATLQDRLRNVVAVAMPALGRVARAHAVAAIVDSSGCPETATPPGPLLSWKRSVL